MCLLSIVLPVYNVEKYIKRCLNSILNQNIDERCELIIVDDESPDNSIFIAKELLKGLDNITIVSQKNRGLGGARNTGIKYAKGEYIWFFDSDDEAEVESISFIYDAISKSKNADIIIFDYIQISNINSKINKFSNATFYTENIEKFLDNHILTTAWRNVYKKSFLINNSILFKEKFLHEDGEFNMRCLAYLNSTFYYPQIIYKYYADNNGSIMNSMSLKRQLHLFEYIKTVDEIEQYKDVNSYRKKQLYSRYLSLSLSMLIKQSIELDTNDFKEFRKLLKIHKKAYIQYIINKSLKKKIQFFIELNFINRNIYKFLF